MKERHCKNMTATSEQGLKEAITLDWVTVIGG